MPLAKGGSVDDVERELKGKLLPAMTVNWMYWTPAQFVNFYFVPQRYQGESRTLDQRRSANPQPCRLSGHIGAHCALHYITLTTP